jgi:APA family basic amino acid/polyamine antiporter
LKLAWSISAFCVLAYYAITNASALALPAERRRYPRWVSVLGLVGCLGLAAFVDPAVVAVAAAVLGVGLAWFVVARMIRGRR